MYIYMKVNIIRYYIYEGNNIYHDFKINFGKTRLYNVAQTVSCC